MSWSIGGYIMRYRVTFTSIWLNKCQPPWGVPCCWWYFSVKVWGAYTTAGICLSCDENVSSVTHLLNNSFEMENLPSLLGGILPGSYHYLHIAKPAIPTPLEVQMAQPNYVSIVSEFHFTFKYKTLFIRGWNSLLGVFTVMCRFTHQKPTGVIVPLDGPQWLSWLGLHALVWPLPRWVGLICVAKRILGKWLCDFQGQVRSGQERYYSFQLAHF